MSVKETIKENLLKIKAIFSTPAPVEPTPAPAKLDAAIVSYAVDGGLPVYTDISNDNISGLDVNDAVFTDETLATPYADGTYTVTGTKFSFTVAAGVITSIEDADGTGPGEAIKDVEPATPPTPNPAPNPAPNEPAKPATQTQMTPEEMRALYEKFAVGTPEERITNLEIMVKALMEYAFGWDLRQAQEKASREAAINVYKTTVENATAQMAKQEQFNSQTIQLLEQMIQEPSANPQTIPENKKEGFKASKEERIERFAASIKKMKEDKKVS